MTKQRESTSDRITSQYARHGAEQIGRVAFAGLSLMRFTQCFQEQSAQNERNAAQQASQPVLVLYPVANQRDGLIGEQVLDEAKAGGVDFSADLICITVATICVARTAWLGQQIRHIVRRTIPLRGSKRRTRFKYCRTLCLLNEIEPISVQLLPRTKICSSNRRPAIGSRVRRADPRFSCCSRPPFACTDKIPVLDQVCSD